MSFAILELYEVRDDHDIDSDLKYNADGLDKDTLAIHRYIASVASGPSKRPSANSTRAWQERNRQWWNQCASACF